MFYFASGLEKEWLIIDKVMKHTIIHHSHKHYPSKMHPYMLPTKHLTKDKSNC